MGFIFVTDNASTRISMKTLLTRLPYGCNVSSYVISLSVFLHENTRLEMEVSLLLYIVSSFDSENIVKQYEAKDFYDQENC